MTIVNKCEFRGHLGKDPVINTTSGGDKVANLYFATNPADIPDGQGGWTKRKPDWISVAVFKPAAIKALEHMKSGDGIRVVGSLGLRDGRPDTGTGQVQRELSLTVASRYPGNGVWAWDPKAEREAEKAAKQD